MSGLFGAFVLVFASVVATAQDAVVRSDGSPDKARRAAFVPITEVPSLLATIVVNNNGDATDATPGDGVCETVTGNGVCTLRAAVAEANALAGNDVITFDPSVALIQINGQIAISSNLSIVGPGPNLLTIQNTAPLATTSRIFNITNFVVGIHGVTLAGGIVTGNGGAIQNTGTLTITSCVIRNNSANGSTGIGGGIRSTNTLRLYNSVLHDNSSAASTSGGISFAGATLEIRNSTIRNNTSFGNGGGMNISATSSVLIRNSTISNNTAGAASGGLFLNRGEIVNSTISGNTANGSLATEGGGGIRIQAGANTVAIISSTITNNSAPNTAAGARGGIWHETGTLTLSNTIIAANVTQDIQRDGTGVITNSGHNLIGRNTSVTTEFPAGLPNGTNYVGTSKSPLDPLLGSLANNGGPTFTHLPQTGSLAIDNGVGNALAGDQRDFIRTFDVPGVPNAPSGNGTDIGSVEAQSIPRPAAVSISGSVVDTAGIGIPRVLLVMTDPNGNSLSAITNNFGRFTISGLNTEEVYVISAYAKELLISPSVILLPGLAEMNFQLNR
ncbi:right-handed parallel beta-helix repeat-containing protein [Leptolyngbya sp. 7M]|uniref:right-handed parallel beta-helix repeat-containing protein n=1 Tax=Leptolyngbya sp. 7M TaxID=2812896 RepID=UPI001B8B9D4F|nr:right-handed parallel beta-helix repeat-containing protein [Leptolyngbya sp. 7M]QYO65963.1 right-handed parallel beta-helix repeat-containing protein [Leptolyngbya sp. 7M]